MSCHFVYNKWSRLYNVFNSLTKSLKFWFLKTTQENQRSPTLSLSGISKIIVEELIATPLSIITYTYRHQERIFIVVFKNHYFRNFVRGLMTALFGPFILKDQSMT